MVKLYMQHLFNLMKAPSHSATNLLQDALDHPPAFGEAPEKLLVFMPTYAPEKPVASEHTRPVEPLPMEKLRERCHSNALSTPWTYLDAIDSIHHVLGDTAQLVVADFCSSKPIQKILQHHQAASNMPSYELWCAEKPHSQWLAMNLVLQQKLQDPNIEYVIFTSSDIIWWQRSWVAEALLAMRKDADMYIGYPTVTRAENDLKYQEATGPRDEAPFTAGLCNAYVAVFRADFFRLLNNKYPDIFRNCFTESMIPHLLKAMGAHQCVIPRANCWHYKNGDIWQDDTGADYFYGKERPVYNDVKQAILEYRKEHPLDIRALPALQKLLYREDSYYMGVDYTIYKEGRAHPSTQPTHKAA